MSNRLYSSKNEDANLVAEGIKALSIIFGSFVLIGLAYLYGAFSLGYVGMTLWTWFVVPVFDLPLLSWGQAYGIAVLVGLWTHQYRVNITKDERTASEKVGHSIGLLLTPWLILLVGWLGKVFFL